MTTNNRNSHAWDEAFDKIVVNAMTRTISPLAKQVRCTFVNDHNKKESVNVKSILAHNTRIFLLSVDGKLYAIENLADSASLSRISNQLS